MSAYSLGILTELLQEFEKRLPKGFSMRMASSYADHLETIVFISTNLECHFPIDREEWSSQRGVAEVTRNLREKVDRCKKSMAKLMRELADELEEDL